MDILNIGVLTPNEYGHYYGVLLNSIAKRAHEKKIRAFVIQTRWSNDITRPSEYDEKIGWNQFDAWIVLPNAISPDYLEKLCNLGKPVILISDDTKHPGTKAVVPDNYGGMKNAINHLISHGHKKIAFVYCYVLNDQVERMKGYHDAMKEAGLKCSEEDIYSTNNAMVSGGEEVAEKLLKKIDNYSAIAVSCDYNAIGIINILKKNKIRVPGDIAFVSFDNMENGKKYTPPLTSVNADLTKLAGNAVDLVVREINQYKIKDRVYISPSELVIRESCGCTGYSESIDEYKTMNERYEVVFNSLAKVVFEIINVGDRLFSTRNETINLEWMLDTVRWASIGFYRNEDDERIIYIKDAVLFNRTSGDLKKDFTDFEHIHQENIERSQVDKSFKLSDFPPISILPKFTDNKESSLVWIQPFKMKKEVRGIMLMIAPYHEGLFYINIDFWQRILDQFTLYMEIDELNKNLVEKVDELKKSSEDLEKANRELAISSVTDSLSGLANRRFFDVSLIKEVSNANRRNEPLGLIMIDIDHFKLFNDNYGHVKGDDCIKFVSQKIKESVYRPKDFIARYGGEEFVMVLPNTDTSGTALIAERLRAEIEAGKYPHKASPISQFVTVSAGYTILNVKDKETAEDLLARADRALYKSKTDGRNRVTLL